MKFVYFGTADFAVPSLQRLAPHISLVVSQPPRPSGRGMKLHSSPVHLAAEELGLPVETPERARNPEFVERIRSENADALVVAAYGQILSMALLESASNGGINLHGSLLPEYRGAAPIQRCLMDGRTETGVTLMQMDKGMDTGDEIDRVVTPIHPDETYGELQARLALLAADLVEDWAPRLAAGDYPRTPQNHDTATHAAKIDRSEGELLIAMPARDAYNRYRAVTPHPAAFLQLSAGPMKIVECRRVEGTFTPGSLHRDGESWILGFAEGGLEIRRVRPAGKPEVSFADFLNGQRLREGDLLLT